MTQSTKDKLLYRRIDEVIHYLWDPIGVSDIPTARDEYVSYIPEIFKIVQEAKSVDTIARHLSDLQTSRFGINTSHNRCNEVAEILVNWKACIDESTA